MPHGSGGMGGMGGKPGGMPSGMQDIFNDPELMELMRDEEVIPKLSRNRPVILRTFEIRE